MIDDNNRKQQNCVSNDYSYLSISESSIIQVRNPILEDNQLWEFFNPVLCRFFLVEILSFFYDIDICLASIVVVFF